MEKWKGKLPRRQRRIWKGILTGVLVLLAAAALTVYFTRGVYLDIQLKGEQDLTLEYGQSYEEPGVKALLCDVLLWREGRIPRDLQLQTNNAVDEKSLGVYTITYTADYNFWHKEVQRTVRIVDTQPPVITLTRDPAGSLKAGTAYQEAGYQAIDNYDGDITDRVVRIEESGYVTYSVVDSSGNPAYAQREIPYYNKGPEITLTGGETVSIPCGTFFEEPGYLAQGGKDGALTDQVAVEGEVIWYQPGTYPLTYTVSDSSGKTASVTRTVEVEAKARPEMVWPDGKVIYLTFDDGPGPYTLDLLDVLDKYGVKATFFVTDSGYDNVMEEIVDRGHSIGIHTVSHKYEDIYASPEAYFTDLYRMQDIIFQNTGVNTTLMRFPGGSSNTVSCGTYEGLMTILSESVRDAGFQYFDWNVDSDDAGNAKNTKTVVQNVITGVSQCRVAVVLQHDIHDYSVEAVEDILIWGLNNGYTFQALTPNSPGMHHGVYN